MEKVGDPSLKDVLVDTIDSAQGHENDTVIFNPVVTVRARRGNEAVGHLEIGIGCAWRLQGPRIA